ncbi:MAG: 3-dehydroquinate synthase, partial [Cyanobacteria bacterium]|nr:3-dehydroquinate synthase [Cyanobacteriota bacterium]MDW8203242.1 3-dehydroquinate synthase [Cyanobacteriota bacterium SKYGB_h_bin112]
LAVTIGFWDQQSTDRQLALIQKAGLPTMLPSGLDVDAILALLQTDKKVQDGQVRFVLPTQIGSAQVTDQVPRDAIRHVLTQMQPSS